MLLDSVLRSWDKNIYHSDEVYSGKKVALHETLAMGFGGNTKFGRITW
jgi:hypothetical protein